MTNIELYGTQVIPRVRELLAGQPVASLAMTKPAHRGRDPMTAVGNLADFQALDPFFRIIEEGVAGLADGEHFFDLLAEDVVFEYVITVPATWSLEGRSAAARAGSPYARRHSPSIVAAATPPLHHDQATGVVVLEYASQGRAIPTGTAYSNRYISMLSIVDRKIAHWRDYLDPIAVFDAIGWPAAH